MDFRHFWRFLKIRFHGAYSLIWWKSLLAVSLIELGHCPPKKSTKHNFGCCSNNINGCYRLEMDFRHFWRFLKIRFQSGAQVDVVAIDTAAKLEGHGEAVYRIPVFPVEHGLWTLDLWSVSASGENGRKMTFWPFCIRTEWDLGDFLDARACGGCPKDVRDEAEGHFRRRQRCSQLARLARVDFWLCIDNSFRVRAELILTWLRGHRDHEGGSPRARPFHCTSVGLTPAIIPNVDNSGVQFLLAG